MDGEKSFEDGKESEDQDKDTPHCKPRRKTPVVAQINKLFARFAESMRNIEIAKVEVHAMRLDFDKRCHEDLIRKRAEQRQNDVRKRVKRDPADMNRLQEILSFAVNAKNNVKKK